MPANCFTISENCSANKLLSTATLFPPSAAQAMKASHTVSKRAAILSIKVLKNHFGEFLR